MVEVSQETPPTAPLPGGAPWPLPLPGLLPLPGPRTLQAWLRRPLPAGGLGSSGTLRADAVRSGWGG